MNIRELGITCTRNIDLSPSEKALQQWEHPTWDRRGTPIGIFHMEPDGEHIGSMCGNAFSLFLSFTLSLASSTCFAVFGWDSAGEFIGHRVDGKVGHSSLYSAGNLKKIRSQRNQSLSNLVESQGGFKSLKRYGTALLFRFFRVFQMESSFEDFREAAEMMNGRIFQLQI